MSSRKEEKERLRREREEAERAAAASEGRRRMVAIGLGAAVVIAAIVVGVLLLTGGDDSGGEPPTNSEKVPPKRISDLDEAAKAAGCKVAEHPNEGREHLSDPEQTVEYKTNPPTSGTHHPQAAQDGFYPNPPDLEQSVHSLEHGRVNIQWKAGTPANRVDQLETLFNEEVRGEPGFHTLAFENQSEMTAAVAATGWTHSLTCPEFNDQVFDAIRAFREEMIVGEFASDIPELQP